MNLIALALCLIAQASFHPFFLFFPLLDVSRISVHIYISNLDFIVNRVHPSIHILSYLPLCIFSSYRSPSSLNIGVPCYFEPLSIGLIDHWPRLMPHDCAIMPCEGKHESPPLEG
jgi:hypothetical protein